MIHACSHRPPCPGCPRYGEGGVAVGALGVLRELACSSGALLDPVVEGARESFRVRARLAVRGRASSPKIGIFQQDSHRIVDVPSCVIHHPRINETVRVLKDCIRDAGVAPYVDASHRGLLRYLQVVVERGSGAVQVVLVCNDAVAESVLPLADCLTDRLGPRLHSLWWNGNPERTNVIFGPHWQRLSGPEALRERIGGAAVFFPPGAFGQSNLDLADRIVAAVHGLVPDGAVVAEAYAGCGSFGLGLLARAREVRLNEDNPHGLRGLELGLAERPAHERAKARVLAGDASACAAMFDGADVALVDPPRRGLDAAVLETIMAARPRLLIYVSCGPSSLSRDCQRLLADGALRLRRLTPFALFPYTEHVETLALFEAA
ncbi:MAG: class I SAM-dependent RNA methyltransferase [Deltaproteobacteria bacterium]|nr:class I SAM-dependent RNA methyltransferase [Deltaproteobacteria bacterium]